MRARWRVGAGLLAVASLLAGTAVVGATASNAVSAAPGEGRMSGPLQELSSGGASRRAGPAPAAMRQRGARDTGDNGPGSLVETPDGLLVQAFSDDLTPALIEDLEDAGATVVHVRSDLGIATVSADTSELAGIAAVSGVRYVAEVLEPVVGHAERPSSASGASVAQPSCGAALSEGDAHLNAAGLRSTWDTEGYGIEVGLLSDSWNRATNDATSLAQDIASGDIPGAGNPCPGLGRTTPVAVLAEGPTTGADEGRAMAQIVHDLAPAAQISFATAFTGDLAFADNIRALKAHGADVIVDDVFYYNEPAYQNGPIGVAVSDVVAGGAAFFSAVGNENETLGGHPVGSYEAQSFRPTPCPYDVVGTCHDFDASTTVDPTFGFTIPAGGDLNLTLKWDEPWNGVLTDYDLRYFVGGVEVAYSLNNNPSGTKQPFEAINATVTTSQTPVEVVVSRRAESTATPRFKLEHIRSDLSAAEYTTPTGTDVMGPNAVGHPVVPTAVAVGAISYTSTTTPEPFSSRGPATWRWGPVVGSSPAAPVTPLTIAKPDIVATDGGRTTFFYDTSPPFTAPRFSGTSAAAPHAAAVAALLRACNPGLTPAGITDVLRSTASPVSGGEVATVGSGRVNALAAGNATCLPPTAGPSFAVSDATVTEGNGGLLTTPSALTFTVTLSRPLTTASSVQYQTVNGTAVAPGDFTAKALTTLTFSAGQTSKTVSVTVKGDTVPEVTEGMTLRLSGAAGAPISDADGVGTITNDDPFPVVPVVSVSDATKTEGSGGITTINATFTITLSAPAPGTISVVYQTGNGTAEAPADFTAKAPTTLTFSKGQTSKTVNVSIARDRIDEPDEIFFLLLTSPVGMTIGDGTGTATIVDDD